MEIILAGAVFFHIMGLVGDGQCSIEMGFRRRDSEAPEKSEALEVTVRLLLW
jgi:hypothetical protein